MNLGPNPDRDQRDERRENKGPQGRRKPTTREKVVDFLLRIAPAYIAIMVSVGAVVTLAIKGDQVQTNRRLIDENRRLSIAGCDQFNVTKAYLRYASARSTAGVQEAGKQLVSTQPIRDCTASVREGEVVLVSHRLALRYVALIGKGRYAVVHDGKIVRMRAPEPPP